MLILILVIVFIALLFLVFRHPAPSVDRLIFFLLLVGVGIVLAFLFAQRLLDYDPDPDRLRIARAITNDKIVDFTRFVPGLPEDLDLIYRLDTDQELDDRTEAEWLVLYRYDEVGRDENKVGPFGAVIYDMGKCRPPAILSYELVPENYDYLSLDLPRVNQNPKKSDVIVDNIIKYKEDYGDECWQPIEEENLPDRPEVIVFGRTNGVQTDLNIFRLMGQDLNCNLRDQWELKYADTTYPCSLRYENIGSWRGNYKVTLNDNVVTTYDRSPFERSVLVIKRVYKPDLETGSYFMPTTDPAAGKVLRAPEEVGIVFGPGIPEDAQQVYYPEKTVVSFFLQLGSDVDKAMENVCGTKGPRRRYDPNDFGLTLSEGRLEKLTVCEIRYNPDIIAERNHLTQTVTIGVVEVPRNGSGNCSDVQLLKCEVGAELDPRALPYGCQWCLSGCVAIEE